MHIKFSRSHVQVIARFTCGKIHTVILATNDLSIYLPFCAKTILTAPQLELKVFTCKKKKKKKYVIRLAKKKDIQQLIYSRRYAPKNFPRGLSPNSAAWRARTMPGGGKEHSVWTAALLRLLSLPSSHTVCVTVCVPRCRKVSPTLPSSLLFLSHLLRSPPLYKLTHCGMDAQRKTFRWRMRFAFLLKFPLSSSSHQLWRSKEFEFR